jgi:predicted site-specific integrase-resolvase
MQPDSSEQPGLETSQAIGLRVGVSAETIRLWSRRGWIPSVRISAKVIRFEWDAVLSALRARGVAVKPKGGR